jgi:hypothetical protein
MEVVVFHGQPAMPAGRTKLTHGTNVAYSGKEGYDAITLAYRIHTYNAITLGYRIRVPYTRPTPPMPNFTTTSVYRVSIFN